MSGARRRFLAVAALSALCTCGGASALASTARTHHDAGTKLSKKCRQHSWRAHHPHRCHTTHHAKKSPLPGSFGMASTGPLTAAPILQAVSAATPAPMVPPSVPPVSPPPAVTELPSEVEAPIEPQGEPPSIPHVQVSALEYSFTLSRTRVPAGKVVLQFVNNGQDAHNLHLETGEEPLTEAIGNTPSKGVGNLELELRPGAYTLFCSLPTHEAKGMKAVLEVE
jgi:plastocyanin